MPAGARHVGRGFPFTGLGIILETPATFSANRHECRSLRPRSERDPSPGYSRGDDDVRIIPAPQRDLADVLRVLTCGCLHRIVGAPRPLPAGARRAVRVQRRCLVRSPKSVSTRTRRASSRAVLLRSSRTWCRVTAFSRAAAAGPSWRGNECQGSRRATLRPKNPRPLDSVRACAAACCRQASRSSSRRRP